MLLSNELDYRNHLMIARVIFAVAKEIATTVELNLALSISEEELVFRIARRNMHSTSMYLLASSRRSTKKWV